MPEGARVSTPRHEEQGASAMFSFQPFAGMHLFIGTTLVEFLPHPLFPGDKDAVFVLEGGEALIYKVCTYQVLKTDPLVLHALKVFKPLHRRRHMLQISNYLAGLVNQPGLQLSLRACITKTSCPELVKRFPELEFAVLMPWIETATWAGFLLDQATSARYTLARARKQAVAMANVLWNLESRGLAHADIAGCNVLLTSPEGEVQLLDLEGMYAPGLPVPEKVSYGSPGYQHRCLGTTGQWCPEGDRFAGAILLTEMLTWWNPEVRAQISEFAETLFRPEELQLTGLPCRAAVRETLLMISPDLLALFDQAWNSATLAECPDFATWTLTLLSAFS